MIWGFLRKEQGLPFMGAPTVEELENPGWKRRADSRARPSGE